MSHNKMKEVQGYITESENIVIEDITNFNETMDVRDVYANIEFHIKMKKSLLPDLKTFLMNKTDLYIMNGIHGSIYKDYDVVTVPNHFFRIKQVQFGSCNISSILLYTEIYDEINQSIKQTYHNKTLARQPIRKIGRVLKTVQKKLFDINTRININMNKHPNYNEFKKYSHIKPEISEFRVDDKMVNKSFSTSLLIVPHTVHKGEILMRGKVLYKEKIFIVSPNGKFYDRLNLLDYLMPNTIQHVESSNEWILKYNMQDIMDLLEANNIKRTVFVDLSCANQQYAVNNTQSIMDKTALIEGRKYGSIGSIRKSRNKNFQSSF